MKTFSVFIGIALLFCSCASDTQSLITADSNEAEKITKEAYIFSYPILMGCQAQFYTTSPQSPGYREPLNQISNDTIRQTTPERMWSP
jgi:hypothetical protein